MSEDIKKAEVEAEVKKTESPEEQPTIELVENLSEMAGVQGFGNLKFFRYLGKIIHTDNPNAFNLLTGKGAVEVQLSDLSDAEVESVKRVEQEREEERKENIDAAEKILENTPMKRDTLKRAIRLMSKHADMLVLYSDPESKARGIYFLGRVCSYHPGGMAMLGPDEDDIPQYAIIGSPQLPLMGKFLLQEKFTLAYTTDKEESLIFIRPNGKMNIETGEITTMSGIILTDTPMPQ